MAATGINTDKDKSRFELPEFEPVRFRYPSENKRWESIVRGKKKNPCASSTDRDANGDNPKDLEFTLHTEPGDYIVAISTVTDKDPFDPHPHRLVAKNNCPNDLDVVIIPVKVVSSSFDIGCSFAIERATKDEAADSLINKCKLICQKVNFDPVVPSDNKKFSTSDVEIRRIFGKGAKKNYRADRLRLMFVAFRKKTSNYQKAFGIANEAVADTKPKLADNAVTDNSLEEFRKLVPMVDGDYYDRVCEKISEVLIDKTEIKDEHVIWQPTTCSVFGGESMVVILSAKPKKANRAKKNYKVQYCTDDSFDKSESIWFAEAEVTNNSAQIFECTIPPYTGTLELGPIPAHESKTARSDQGTSTVNVNGFNCEDIKVYVRLCAFTKTSGAANSENEPEVISDGFVFTYTAAPVTHQFKHKQAQPNQFTPAQSQPNQSAASNATKADNRDRLAQRMNNPNLPPDSNPNQTQHRPLKQAVRKGDRSGGGGAAISVTPSVGAGAATTAMQPQTRPTVNPVIRFASPGPPTGVATAARGPTIYYVSRNQQLSANFPQPGTSASASACASGSGSGLSVEARTADTDGLGASMYYTAQPVGSGNSAGVGVGTFGQAAPQQGSSQPNLHGFLESSTNPLLVSHDNSYSGSQTNETAFVADGNQSYVGTLNSDGDMFNPVSSEINQQEDFDDIAIGQLVQSLKLQAADDSTAPAPAPAPNAPSNSNDNDSLDLVLQVINSDQFLQELNSSENQQHLENFTLDNFDDSDIKYSD